MNDLLIVSYDKSEKYIPVMIRLFMKLPVSLKPSRLRGLGCY